MKFLLVSLILLNSVFCQNSTLASTTSSVPQTSVILPTSTIIEPPSTSTSLPLTTAASTSKPVTATVTASSSSSSASSAPPTSAPPPPSSEATTQPTFNFNSIIIPVSVIVGCILIAIIGIYVFRKFSLAPSSNFRKRIQNDQEFKGNFQVHEMTSVNDGNRFVTYEVEERKAAPSPYGVVVYSQPDGFATVDTLERRN